MTTLSFDAIFRDRGAVKGFRTLGLEAEKTRARLEKLASSDAVGAKFGERFRQGFVKGTAKLSASVTDRLAATAAGGKITAAGAKVGDRFSIGFLKPAQRLGEQVSQRLTAISSSRFVTAGSKLGTYFHSGFAKATAKMSESISRAASRGGGSSGGARGFVSMGARLGGNFRAGFIKPIGGLPGIIAGLVGGAVIMGAKRLATEASDMNETVSKTRTIFGTSSKAIESWAKGAAKNLGMSRQQALDGASAFGNLFDQLGFGVGQSAKMSKGFAQMATDAASFNNANPAEVMDAFLAATRGEYDALQRYIPTVNAAAIETYALSSGIVKATKDTDKIQIAQQRAEIAQHNYNAAVKEHGKGSIEARRAQVSLASAQGVVSKVMKGSVGELTAAQKAQALYELSTRDLGAAHGDFSKTAVGFANQQRIMAANWADLRVKIGTYFLPMFTKAAKYMNDEGFPALTRIVDVLGTVGKAAGRMGTAVLKVFSTTFATAIDGATTNLTEIADWMETHQEKMVRFFIRLGDGAIGFGRGIVALAVGGIRSFGDMSGAMGETVRSVGNGIASLMEGAAKLLPPWSDARRDLLRGAADIRTGSQKAADGLANTKTKAHEAADAISRKATPAFDAAQRALHRVGEEEIWKAKQRDAAAKASHAIRDVGLKADGSQIKLKTWNERTRLGSVEQARLEVRLMAARRRMLEQREAGIKAGDSQVLLTKRWDKGREALRREFIQMGLSSKEARTLANRYGAVPKSVVVKHSTPGGQKARTDAVALKNRLAELKDKKLNITFATNAASVAGKFNVNFANSRELTVRKKKAGGPIQNVSGRGRRGVDTEPVLAAVGEHMWTDREVAAVGGHRAMHRMRQDALAGKLRGYAEGGPIRRNVVVTTGDPGVSRVPSAFDTIANRVARAVGVALGTRLRDALAAAVASAGAGSSASWRGGSFRGLSNSQMNVAAAVASVGAGMGKKAQLIGLIAGLVESRLTNVNYGDRDSLGVFQQRAPWGPASVRRNVRASAGMFFHGGRGGQRGLDDIGGWRGMSPGRAAQRVQVSAFPGRYATQVPLALSILSALTASRGAAALAGSGRGGSWMGGTRPVPGSAKRHSGYPWANWAGDFKAGGGTPIRAWRAGYASAVNRWGFSYGNHVRAKHAGGPETLSAHMSRIAVRRGQRFGQGAIIGYVGSTGNATGDHLHWEIKGLSRGGVVSRPSLVGVGERGPERVLSAKQTNTFDRMVRVMERGGGAGGGNTYITINVPNGFVGDHHHLRQTLVDMNRRGQLDVIKR